jgi:hypothetical protein
VDDERALAADARGVADEGGVLVENGHAGDGELELGAGVLV